MENNFYCQVVGGPIHVDWTPFLSFWASFLYLGQEYECAQGISQLMSYQFHMMAYIFVLIVWLLLAFGPNRPLQLKRLQYFYLGTHL
ncbi:MAG: hypothetical protein MJE68_18305 [Proteobacteria bacterium]|nr:hypothetical protein [Pseudomonadota bacterium]